jgi:hypothetical protein
MDAMYVCSVCKTEKPRSEFWARNDRKNGKGIHSRCKGCSSISYDKWRLLNKEKRRRDLQKWRSENPDRIKKLYRSSDNNRRNTTKEWVNELKNRPCVDCKRSYEPFVMDFDHREPLTKKYVISFMVSKRMPKKAILEEIEKCDLVCSNCHRIRTYRKI